MGEREGESRGKGEPRKEGRKRGGSGGGGGEGTRLFHDGESGADPHRTYRPKLWQRFSCKMNILMFQEMFSTALRVRENPVA